MRIFDVVAWCTANSYACVCVQLPDVMLDAARRLSHWLQERLGEAATVYVLADTTYASCCVDVVAAAHVRGACIVHYGDACLSPTDGRLPVFYVWPKGNVDVPSLVRHMGTCTQLAHVKRVVLVYELAYDCKRVEVVSALVGSVDAELVVAQPIEPTNGLFVLS